MQSTVAELAQLVERWLPKPKVASSRLVFRSKPFFTRMKDSELIINGDGSIFHLHILPEDIADDIIVMGDPSRVLYAAELFDSVELDKSSREFHTVTGRYHGKRITAISHGIGTDNIDILMTELDALANVDFATGQPRKEHRALNIVRIGTCGSPQSDIPLGSYVFSRISLGLDPVIRWYKEGDKILLDDMEKAFLAYMKDWPVKLNVPYFVQADPMLSDKFAAWTIAGITVSAPGFYGPQGRAVRLHPSVDSLTDKLAGFTYGGLRITNIEMESSALSGMAAMLGHKAGTVCLVVANRNLGEANPDYKPMMAQLLKKVLDTLT